jgi:anti-anti-sigma factor
MGTSDLIRQPIDVLVTSESGAIAVCVRGDVDVATVEVLRCALEAVEDASELVVDLSGTMFIDIAGIRAVARCARRRRAIGRDLLVIGPPPSSEWILQNAPFSRDLRWEPRPDGSSTSLPDRDVPAFGPGARPGTIRASSKVGHRREDDACARSKAARRHAGEWDPNQSMAPPAP